MHRANASGCGGLAERRSSYRSRPTATLADSLGFQTDHAVARVAAAPPHLDPTAEDVRRGISFLLTSTPNSVPRSVTTAVGVRTVKSGRG